MTIVTYMVTYTTVLWPFSSCLQEPVNITKAVYCYGPHGLHHVYPCQSTEEIFMLSYKLKDLFIVINYKLYINIIVLKMNANTLIIILT